MKKIRMVGYFRPEYDLTKWDDGRQIILWREGNKEYCHKVEIVITKIEKKK